MTIVIYIYMCYYEPLHYIVCHNMHDIVALVTAMLLSKLYSHSRHAYTDAVYNTHNTICTLYIKVVEINASVHVIVA